MKKHLMGAALAALLVANPVAAHPLDGFYIGPVVGHLQTGSTVKFEGAGQINDVSGNTHVPGVVMGWSHAFQNRAFFGLDIWGLVPIEPYPSTIVQFAGREYLVERRWETSVMGRAGVTLRDATALYAGAGVMASGVTYTVDGTRLPRVLWTPQFGVGMETAITDRISLRGDWLWDWVKQDLGPVRVQYEFRTRASLAVVWRF